MVSFLNLRRSKVMASVLFLGRSRMTLFLFEFGQVQDDGYFAGFGLIGITHDIIYA